MAFPILICFLFFLLPSFSSSSVPSCNPHDHYALVQFKNQFTASALSKTFSWGSNGSNCCLWDGVTCDSVSGHVIGLDLSLSYLIGQLTSNSTLFQLVHLQTLNLAYNFFEGSLPSEFGDLHDLTHLNLSFCVEFTGEIPPKFTQLSKLVSLDLSSIGVNLRLEHSTWESLISNMTDLRELILDDVNMSSIITSSFNLFVNFSSPLFSLRLKNTNLKGNITSDIFHLQNLQQVDLSGNRNLQGQLPRSNWSSPLSFLDLSFTSFSGGIFDSLGDLRNLTSLNLESCGFEGPLPLGFRNLTQLNHLNLGSNKLSGEISLLSNLKLLSSLVLRNNSFSGQIPSSLSSLNHLTTLDFSQNNFNGEITNMFGELLKLESLSISRNNLEGKLPSLSNLSRLSSFDCSFNKLVGPIPNDICKLPMLVTLELSHNLFNGTIPPGCYSSPSLNALNLNDNLLIGSIGQFSSYSLVKCDLSKNKFKGNFPDSIFSLTNLSDLRLSSNYLNGVVDLYQFSKLQKLTNLDLSNNKFLSLVSFNENVEITKLTYLSYVNLSSCNINDFPLFLVNLPNLDILSLSYNKIQGTIPKWFNDVGNGSLAYLDLSHNLLTSVEHLSMRNVVILDLSFNKLQGNLPIPSFGITTFFSVSNNKISGQISSQICNASSLMILNLSHNNLSGPIPHCLVTFPSMSNLDLRKNSLTGTIPDNFAKNCSLQTLNLNNNNLEGPFPRSLAYCDQLQILDVAENKIEDTFPNWLEVLPILEVLILRENKFYGAITSSKTKHPFLKLRIFDISNNLFNGSLPAAYIKEFKEMMKIGNVEIGSLYMENRIDPLFQFSVMVNMKGNSMELVKILKIFTTLDLSSNKFEGEIPKVIGELYSLKGLNFSHNGITGSIPQSMGNLENLEWLDLSWNKIEGEIPSTLRNLNFLAILNLSHNKLEGIIPRGKQFDTFSNDSYEGNSRLCGFPLTKSCSRDERKLPQPESSSTFGFGWKPVAIGYGCGTIFGIFMGYIVLIIGKPQWLVKTFGGQTKRQRKTRVKARANQRRMN